MQLVLFNPLIGLYQVLPFRDRVDLGAMSTKKSSVFRKAPASLEPHHHGSYPGHSMEILPLCRGAVGVFYNTSQLSNKLS